MTRAKPKKHRKKARVRVRIPKRTEASIETSACSKILEAWPDVLIRKLGGVGDRHWPDRMLVFSCDFVVFVEFKRPGEKPTTGQQLMINKLRKKGFNVLVADDVTDLMNTLTVTVAESCYRG